MKRIEIVMYGASGHSLAMAQSLSDDFAPDPPCAVVAFIEDGAGAGRQLNGAPVVAFEQWRSDYLRLPALVSIGDPDLRRRLAERLADAGARFPNLYSGHLAHKLPGVEVGCGTYLSARSYIGPETRIGDHVQLMPMCSIGHDVVIADFVTLCPGVVVSGNVVIGEGAFLGAGTVVVNGRAGAPLVIGRGSRIAAGSVVTRTLPPGAKVAGNPARPLREIAQCRSLDEADQ